MSLLSVFDVAGSALAAQSQRLNTVSSNLANAESVAGPDGQPYRARHVVFATQAVGAGGALGVHVREVIQDNAPPRKMHDPKHPLADAQGFVNMANINVVDEMVNMISASRSYQNNAEIMNTAKSLLLKTLNLGQ